MLFEPALESSATHSVDVVMATVVCGPSESTNKPIERLQHFAQRLDDPRLYNSRNPLSGCRYMREIVQRVENVRPRLVFGTALRDRCWKLGDLSRNPAVVIPCVEDREVRRIGSTGGWVRRRAHTHHAINRPTCLQAQALTHSTLRSIEAAATMARQMLSILQVWPSAARRMS